MSHLAHAETWVRFGPNGIGLSGHQNRFTTGVCVGNWVENSIGDAMKQQQQNVLDSGDKLYRLQAETTHAASYKNVVKTDDSHGPFEATSEVPRHLVLNRCIGYDRPTADMATTYELAHCHAAGERKVQDTLWSADTRKNLQLPEAGFQSNSLLEKKKLEWAKQKESVFATTYQKEFQEKEISERDPRGRIGTRQFCKSTDSIHHKLRLRADDE